MEEIESMLLKGEIKAALIIAPGFAQDLQSLKGLPIQIIIDGTEPNSGHFAVENISRRSEQFILDRLSAYLQAAGLLWKLSNLWISVFKPGSIPI